MQVASMFSGIFVKFCMGTSFQTSSFVFIILYLADSKIKSNSKFTNFFVNKFVKQMNQHVFFATKTA